MEEETQRSNNYINSKHKLAQSVHANNMYTRRFLLWVLRLKKKNKLLKVLLVLMLIPIVLFTSLFFVKHSTMIKITAVIKSAQYTDTVFSAKYATVDAIHDSKTLVYAVIPFDLYESQDVNIKDYTFLSI